MEDVAEMKKPNNFTISMLSDSYVKIEKVEESGENVSLTQGSGSFSGAVTYQHDTGVEIYFKEEPCDTASFAAKDEVSFCDMDIYQNNDFLLSANVESVKELEMAKQDKKKLEEKSSRDKSPFKRNRRSNCPEKQDSIQGENCRYACELCNYKTDVKTRLVPHMRSHTGERPFACASCPYTSRDRGSLTIHMQTHTGEKPFACASCPFKSNRKAILASHMLTHTGEKPLACTLCPFKCSDKGNLYSHMRTHNDEKPFACALCHYKSRWKTGLARHMLTHTGEKPFACTSCLYKCRDRGNLTMHMRTHTGEKPFTCKMCPYKCIQKGSLAKHMITHNGNKLHT